MAAGTERALGETSMSSGRGVKRITFETVELTPESCGLYLVKRQYQNRRGDMGRILGYARISTEDQSLDLQTDALRAIGADPVFTDMASGATSARPGLDALLKEAKAGDRIVVWRLDRLGRSLIHLAALAADLERRGIGLQSLTDGVDTSTPTGKLIYGILGSMAEFERESIRERVRAGMAAAKRSGLHVGRPRKMSAEHARDAAARLDAGEPARRVAAYFRVSEATLYRATRPLRALRSN